MARIIRNACPDSPSELDVFPINVDQLLLATVEISHAYLRYSITWERHFSYGYVYLFLGLYGESLVSHGILIRRVSNADQQITQSK